MLAGVPGCGSSHVCGAQVQEEPVPVGQEDVTPCPVALLFQTDLEIWGKEKNGGRVLHVDFLFCP